MQTWVISGASGNLGRCIVDQFSNSNHLILLGRDTEKLKRLFPQHVCMTNDDFLEAPANHDVFINLAVINNNQDLDELAFRKVNVHLLESFFSASVRANVQTFINLNTFHALDGFASDPYSKSKRAGLKLLKNQKSKNTVHIFLPFVYSKPFRGKLRYLNKLPTFPQNIIFHLIKSFYPVVDLKTVIHFLETVSKRGPMPKRVMLADNKNDDVIYCLIKRAIDLIFAMGVLLFFWWLLMAIYLLLLTTSRASPIFSQLRMGLNGTVFNCFKFRTMDEGAPNVGTHEITSASVTKVGRVLRISKLDELPQIFNILNGTMSLVGPRPCLPIQGELIYERKKLNVFSVLPGITGLAQVEGIDMSSPKKLASRDCEYIFLRGTFFDLRLIFMTFLGKGRRDGIVR